MRDITSIIAWICRLGYSFWKNFFTGIKEEGTRNTWDSEVITVDTNRNPSQGKNQCPENKKGPENKKKPEAKKEYGPENKNPMNKGY